MSSSAVSLLVSVIIGLGVIGAGVWRIAAAMFNLAAKVDLLAYRIEQVEQRQGVVLARLERPTRARRRTGD